MRPLLPLATLTLLLAAGCPSEPEPAPDAPVEPEECDTRELPWGLGGADMLPGTDCIECHSEDGRANSVFTIAGTVLRSATCPEPIEGALIHVTDMVGTELSLATGPTGNVWTDAALEPPFLFGVELDGEVLEMQTPAWSGSCASCHTGGTPLGYVFAP